MGIETKATASIRVKENFTVLTFRRDSDLSVVDEVLDAASEAVAADMSGILGVGGPHATAELQRQNDVDLLRVAWSLADRLARSTVLRRARVMTRRQQRRRITAVDHQTDLLHTTTSTGRVFIC